MAEQGSASRRRRIRWAIVVAACCVALVVVLVVLLRPTHVRVVPTHVDAASLHGVRTPCTWPGRLLAAGRLKEAADAYHALARRPHVSDTLRECARDGIRQVRHVRDQRAAALRARGGELGLSPATITRLATAVRIAPGPAAVARSMAGGIALDGGAYGMRIAQALQHAHDEPEAQAVLRATLARFPGADVPVELRGLGGAGYQLRTAQALERAGFDAAAQDEVRAAIEADPTIHVPEELTRADRRPSIWASVHGAIEPWVRVAWELLVAAAVVLVVVLAVVLLRRGMGERRSRRMAIDAFAARGDGHGTTTASSVRESYLRITGNHGGGRMRMVESGATNFATFNLPTGAEDVIPAGRVLAAILSLLERLLPPTVWQVSGELQPRHPLRGAGLRLTLRRGTPTVFSEQTFWERDYEWRPGPDGEEATQENYDRLAVPAAAWLVFQTGHEADEAGVLGTNDWRSYALFAVGAEIQAEGRPREARLRYQRALGLDGDNCGAALNLAVADMQLARDTAAHLDARARLERLEQKIMANASTSGDRNPMWHRIRYNRVVACLSPGRDPQPHLACKLAFELCATIERQLARDFADAPRLASEEVSARRVMRDYLEEVRPTGLLLLASALQEATAPCATTLPRPAALRDVAGLLDEGVRLGGAAPSGLSDRKLVAHVLAAHAPLRPGARYNLACWCVRAGDHEHARHELREALEQGDALLRRLALDDVVLAPLRADVELILRELGVLPPAPLTTGERVRARLRQLGDLVLGSSVRTA